MVLKILSYILAANIGSAITVFAMALLSANKDDTDDF